MPTVSEVLERADYLLKQQSQAESVRRWTRTELYLWVADALAAIYKADPSAGAVIGELTLVQGTKQEAPDTWDVILDIYRNRDSGQAVRLVDRSTLDAVDPYWHGADPCTDIDEWFPGDMKRLFYVNPPASAATVVEARGVLKPPTLSDGTDEITLPDLHVETAANYVVYRGLSKDGEEGLAAIAAAFYSAFKAGLPVAEGGAK